MLAALLLLALAPSRPAAAADLSTSTLTVCDDVQEPTSLNPYQVFSEKALTLQQQIMEGLVRFDSQGRVEPALAESWERVDPTTVRFHLRQGVLFHNGEKFDAESVKFSLEKYVAPETRFPGYGFMETIASVRVVDPYTVDVITRGPDGLLLNRLAAAWAHIVPAAYYRSVGDEGFARAPVGTGSFQFDRWERGKAVYLSRNARYWKSGVPKVDRLIFKFIPLNEQVDALLGNGVDILTSLPGTRTLDVQESSSTFVVKQPTFYTVVGNFNLSRKPLSDKRVREAINLAVDRKQLVRYDLLGNGVPIGSITLPGEAGHDATVPPYPFDAEKARRLLDEAGYPHGFHLNVLLKVNAVRTGQIMAKQLERLGIVMDMTLMTDAQIPEMFKRRDRWDVLIADCPDPMYHAFFIRSIFLSGDSPFSLSPDKGFEERMKRLVASLDPEAQRSVSEELDRYIHSEFLALPTYQRIRTYGLRNDVVFTPYISGMPYFENTTLRAQTPN